MPSSKKPTTLRIADLSDSEATELRTFFEAYGITAQTETEETGQLMYEKLSEFVKGNKNHKYWMYYMLGDMLTMRGQLDEAFATYSRATRRRPGDPRAWYCLGVMHRAISYEPDRRKNWQKDLTNASTQDQKLADHMLQWEKQNQKFLQAAFKSKLAESPIETANMALTYFKKTLACNISDEDKARVQQIIESIEEWKRTKESR